MFLKDKSTSLCTHHFHFLPMLSSLVNPETASSIVSLTTCMAWNDVVAGKGLTTRSTIISWSLMAKRDQRTSIWAKGRTKGNRLHPEFMTATKNYCYIRAHKCALKNYAIYVNVYIQTLAIRMYLFCFRMEKQKHHILNCYWLCVV